MNNEDHNFNIAHTSLLSNIQWWEARLLSADKTDVKEAQFEIERCTRLHAALMKQRERDLAKRRSTK